MANDMVAIVGSADTSRSYDPPLNDAGRASAAGEALGRALAERGAHLVVYNSEFIERDVVRGYVASGKAQRHSIHVHFPAGTDANGFPELKTNGDLFDDPKLSNSPHWEVAFYQSLGKVQGLVLLGGGRSTDMAGLIALAFRIPLLAVRHFGGAAGYIWTLLSGGVDLPTQEQVNQMGQAWNDSLAAPLVDGLMDQSRRHRLEQRSRGVARALMGLVMLLLLAASFPLGWLVSAREPSFLFQLVLFVVPLVAGAAGAAIRLLVPVETSESTLRVTVLGAAGGLISSVLYLISQQVGGGTPTTASGRFSQVVFAIVIGFLGGFTFDAVFRKLEGVDVVRTKAISADKG
jgi:hypothetical protein